MAGLEDVLQRVANDRSFADAVRSDPTNALRGYQLDPSELARLERVVGAAPSSGPSLFGAAGGASATGVGITKVALLAAGLGLLGGGVGIALGTAGAFGGGNGGGDGSATLRPDAAPFFDCSSDAATGAAMGDLHRGDTVWVIGRTDDGWLVIRNPQDLTTPAWMRAGDLELAGDTGGLPPLTCEQAVTEAKAPLPSATTTAPTSTVPGETTTTAVDSTTTAPTTSVVATTTAPTTSVVATTTAPATTAPATTAADTTGPAVSASRNSALLYSEGGAACVGYLQQITITVTATDPNGATVQGVTWSAGSLNGTATPLGGNQFRIGPVYSTHSGTITMTITAAAVDGRGNAGSGQTTVPFRQIADECIG